MVKRTRYGYAWCFAVVVVAIGLASAREPDNLDLLKQELVRYHDSGEYAYDIDQVAQQALTYLGQRVAAQESSQRQQKLAIVFDIDETSLSNYQHLQALNFGGKPQDLRTAIKQGDDPAISATLNVYRYAESLGVAVFFVTGRTEDLRAATEKNLRTVGYTRWEQLFLKPVDYRQPSVIPYKSGVRKEIETMGYTIVLNMGDQYSDLAGGYAERVFKLPNPYYYIP